MPSKTRSSSRLRSSAAKKIQKRIRGKQTRKQVNKLRASRKIQSRVRGKQTRKVMKRVRTNMLTNNDCSICLEPLTINVATALPCGHRFHKDCIVNWLVRSQGKCPNCKQHITNIPYPSNEEQERQIQPPPPPPPQYILDPIQRRQLLDLEPLQLIQHLTVRNQELDVIEQSIAQQRELLPDAPDIPNIAYELAIVNEVNATDTETALISLHDEACYIRDNYGHYGGRPTRNDEILDDHIFSIIDRMAELLTRARRNARNATRIERHIGSLTLIG